MFLGEGDLYSDIKYWRTKTASNCCTVEILNLSITLFMGVPFKLSKTPNLDFLRFDRLFGPLRITCIIIEEWTSNRFDKCYFTLLNTHIYYGDSWYINQLTNDGDSWYIHQLPRLFQWGSWTISSSFSTKFQVLYIPPPHRLPFWEQLPSCATTHHLE